jgi:hypothetical protein
MAASSFHQRMSAAAGAAIAVLGLASGALAQEPLGVEPTTSPPAPAGIDQAVIARYWELGRPRLFAATMVEVGYAYVRPRFAFGYGLPYWRWLGIEVYPLASLSGLGGYAGIGGALPGVQFRAGGRYFYPFSRSFLEPKDSFDRLDIELLEGPRADYLALEAELTATIPIPTGSLFAIGTGMRTLLVPDGFYQYEETLHAVMKPPYIWRGRLGYLAAFGRDSAIRLGPLAEVIGLPGREELVTRAGIIGSVAINAHLEAQASLVLVVTSPDTLGLAGGDFGQLGVRWRWATGSTPDPAAMKREGTQPQEQEQR